MTEASTIASIDLEVALESAKSYMKLSEKAGREGVGAPSLFDSIILGMASVLKAKVVTGDELFKNLPETLWLGQHITTQS